MNFRLSMTESTRTHDIHFNTTDDNLQTVEAWYTFKFKMKVKTKNPRKFSWSLQSAACKNAWKNSVSYSLSVWPSLTRGSSSHAKYHALVISNLGLICSLKPYRNIFSTSQNPVKTLTSFYAGHEYLFYQNKVFGWPWKGGQDTREYNDHLDLVKGITPPGSCIYSLFQGAVLTHFLWTSYHIYERGMTYSVSQYNMLTSSFILNIRTKHVQQTVTYCLFRPQVRPHDKQK